MYIGEIAEKEIRGTLGSYFQLMITIGILFVYAVGAGVNLFWLSVICGIIPLIFGVVFFLMPGEILLLLIVHAIILVSDRIANISRDAREKPRSFECNQMVPWFPI